MRILIIGATGMDGRILAHQLLLKGYEVIGTYYNTLPNISHQNLRWVKMDLCDDYAISTFKSLFPLDEVYNFGGVTFSPTSIDMPDYTVKANYHTPLAFIEYITKHQPKTKLFQASSSEVFGNISNAELGLTSHRKPHTPYGYAKNMVDFASEYFRYKGFNIYNAISFNHEHVYRKPHFLTRKITRYVSNLVNNGENEKLQLGNIESRRDWSRATTFVDGYVQQMQGEPSELIFASGQTHSVKDILDISFEYYGLNWEDFVEIKKEFIRPEERTNVWGDVSKTKEMINFVPDTSKDFERMIIEMIEYDILQLNNK
jgi:GDPmannose 4,6-dehydratase